MKLSRGILISGGIASGLVAAFVFGLLIPGQRKLRAQRHSVESLQAALASEQEEVKQLAAVYSEVEQLAGRMREFEKLVPCNHDFAETYRSLSEMVESSGLHRVSIQPERPEALGKSEWTRGIPRGGDVMVQPVTLQVEGTLDTVAKFLTSLESWTRLNRIERVTLRLSESGAGRSRAPAGQRVSCTMAISTFYLPRRDAGSVAIAASDVKQSGPAAP